MKRLSMELSLGNIKIVLMLGLWVCLLYFSRIYFPKKLWCRVAADFVSTNLEESNYHRKKTTEVTFRSLALLQSESSARSDEFKGKVACQRLNK